MNKVVTFFADVRKEADKVTWPTRRETLITTAMVLVLSGLFSLFFLLVDFVLAHLSQYLISLHV